MAIITEKEALRQIKQLRDAIADVPEQDEWRTIVIAHLDRASDVIEFPGDNTKSP